jgi:rhombotail lipoprotein
MKRFAATIALIAAVLALTSCMHQSQRHQRGSVVDYLYPKNSKEVVSPSIPKLSLPLTVGIAFVPGSHNRHDQGMTEDERLALMGQVAAHFESLKFVKKIELIPSAYLRNNGGFANLDQVSKMHGVDVVALLSYDQSQFTTEGITSITYWTLIGAYVIPGEKNDTHTMLDAAVFDVRSRKLLFRAPGVSHVKGRSTPINLDEQLRDDSVEGYELARTDMVANLKLELERFKKKIKDQPKDYQVVHKPGYDGAGTTGVGFAAILVFFGLLAHRRRG